MFLGSFLIGLREGLEAALIIGILIAYARRQGRHDLLPRIWSGVVIAVVAALGLGALFTYGRYGLSFRAQEILGGSLSLIAVAMVTWMVFWMITAGGGIKGELETKAGAGLAAGQGWALFWIALVSVGREGIETTLMLWGWALQPLALGGAVAGIAVAVGLGYAIFAGMVRLNLGVFFRWTGLFLIIVAAGILAYGIHDLQEAAVLPGPFSGHPITPTDLRTGEVLVGLTDGPFWMAAFPFGWAFDLSDQLNPAGLAAALLKGTVGFVPLMTWLEVVAWALYLAFVLPRFLRRTFLAARRRTRTTPAPVSAAPAVPDEQRDPRHAPSTR
ncbi:MAG: iron uptake transporter permease EfeU [Propioniciclava sp.]